MSGSAGSGPVPRPTDGEARAGGESPLAIGIDIGGTKIAGAVVDGVGQLRASARADTPAEDVARTRDAIVDMVRRLAAEHPVAAVGIGAAGWVDAARATVRFAPHLAWRDEPLRDQVAARVDLPVVVENDANTAAWAEYRFGAGREYAAARSAADGPPLRSMVMITVGTGIGGGIVLHDRLWRGAHGFAGEPGHQVVVPDGRRCGCGRRGCLDEYASGRALVRLVRQGAAERPATATELLALAGAPAQITGPQVTAAARAGDKLSREAFEQVGRWLGGSLADLVQVFDPDLLVLGGGVSEAGELLLAPVREAYRDALTERGKLPVAPVWQARLGNEAGVIGAADLARRPAD